MYGRADAAAGQCVYGRADAAAGQFAHGRADASAVVLIQPPVHLSMDALTQLFVIVAAPALILPRCYGRVDAASAQWHHLNLYLYGHADAVGLHHLHWYSCLSMDAFDVPCR